jgi:hypothetical protein
MRETSIKYIAIIFCLSAQSILIRLKTPIYKFESFGLKEYSFKHYHSALYC